MEVILDYVNFLYLLSKDVMDFWKIVCFGPVFQPNFMVFLWQKPCTV